MEIVSTAQISMIQLYTKNSFEYRRLQSIGSSSALARRWQVTFEWYVTQVLAPYRTVLTTTALSTLIYVIPRIAIDSN